MNAGHCRDVKQGFVETEADTFAARGILQQRVGTPGAHVMAARRLQRDRLILCL